MDFVIQDAIFLPIGGSGAQVLTSSTRLIPLVRLLQLILLAALLHMQKLGPYRTWNDGFSSRLKNLRLDFFGTGFKWNDSFENFNPLHSTALGSRNLFSSKFRRIVESILFGKVWSLKLTVVSWKNLKLVFYNHMLFKRMNKSKVVDTLHCQQQNTILIYNIP